MDAGRRYPVLIVEGPGARPTQSLFLQQALSIGDRPSYEVEVTGAGRADQQSIAGRSLVVLNDAAEWGARHSGPLRAFVEEGGGLLVVLGERGRPGRTDRDADLLIPSLAGPPVEITGTVGGSIGELVFDHPIFEVFATPHSGDFASARVYRYHRLAAEWEGETIARFSDGAAALVERGIGAGVVLVWTSTLDNYWNDLALQPVFLPFLHRLAAYAIGYREAEEAYTVGETAQLRLPPGEDGAEIRAVSPSGDRAATVASEGLLVLALDEPGIYELTDLPDAWEGPTGLAVNHDPVESDLTPLDLEELTLSVQATDTEVSQASLEGALRPELIERRQSFWWYLLLVACLLLGIETVTANRLSNRDS